MKASRKSNQLLLALDSQAAFRGWQDPEQLGCPDALGQGASFMTNNHCLISGCLFLDLGDEQDRYVQADLFEVGDCYVLNCARGSGSGSSWQVAPSLHRGPNNSLEKLETALAGQKWLAGYVFWEHSGIIIIEKKLAILGDRTKEKLILAKLPP